MLKELNLKITIEGYGKKITTKIVDLRNCDVFMTKIQNLLLPFFDLAEKQDKRNK